MTFERPTFSTTSIREGYDTGEVDRAVEMVLDDLALPEPRLGADQITALRFTPVRLQQGYDMGEVDSWLDLAAAETERRRVGGVEPGQQSAPATTEAAAPAPAPTSYAPATSTAITEVKAGGPGLYLLVLAVVVVVGFLAYVALT
ncbi:DivIVA domain-containing protein [Nocardioides pinisoli]|uniref:DivIVA domain-containing protein n=1 Tax=Nocardioides pinisoli TaxID=2950279 RepID=A0ABT1L0U7_9ACTN|nr:DivIVA domain-containing protein [Nocardioides pinisoli]MCP3423189.1 DivIVA domain-containing protein [Nocardioides pinisoli]